MENAQFLNERRKILDTLFKELYEITGIVDIAYHEIEEGKLFPVYKTQTKKLSNETWQEKHAEYKVKVQGTAVLERIVDSGEFFAINSVKDDPMSVEEFFAFGIESILIFPVKKDVETVATVIVASINEIHVFADQEIQQCKVLVDEFERNFQKIRPLNIY
jgi:GAF domain-containing protein